MLDGAQLRILLVLLLGFIGCERSPASTPETVCSLHEGRATCWSTENRGNPVGAETEHVVRIPGRVSATAVGGLGKFACAISEGAVYCWGVGEAGELGDGVESTERRGPIQVRDISGTVEIAATFGSACALDRNGVVTCWGNLAAIEVMQATNQPLPSRVVNGATAIAAGDLQTCAVTTGVVCWGGRYPGVDGRQYSTAGITSVPGTDGAAKVRAEGLITCATWTDGRERCWSATPIPLRADPAGP